MVKKLTDWRHWPSYFFFFPISFVWLWYCIKSRSLWFFTASNPTLAFGGFEGESKSEMYRRLSPMLYPKSIFIHPSDNLNAVMEEVKRNNITYPFVVKPDVGTKGILFRRILNQTQLEVYHHTMPVTYMIQEFINHPCEVSVFYCRTPDVEKGRITAIIQKKLPEVTGDGVSTIDQLIIKKYLRKEWLPGVKKHLSVFLQNVLPEGKIFRLSHIANVYNGTEFINLPQLIDDKLLSIFDTISHQNDFYYGRYDIMCETPSDLKKRMFIILEFNGAGSAPNHINTKDYTLLKAYREIIMHWRLLHQISVSNRQQGEWYWSFLRGLRFLRRSKKQFDVLKKLDKELVFN